MASSYWSNDEIQLENEGGEGLSTEIIQDCEQLNGILENLNIGNKQELASNTVLAIEKLKKTIDKLQSSKDLNVSEEIKYEKLGAKPKRRNIFQNEKTVNRKIEKMRVKSESTSSSEIDPSSDATIDSDSEDEMDIKKEKQNKKVRYKSKSKINLTKFRKILTSDSDESCRSSVSSSFSEDSETEREYYKKKSKKNTKNILQKVNCRLAHMDNISMPKLEKYSDTSSLALNKYLEYFEDYCKQKFKTNNKNLWICELSDHLTGRTKEAFLSVRLSETSYSRIKYKLLNWAKEHSVVKRVQTRKIFIKLQ